MPTSLFLGMSCSPRREYERDPRLHGKPGRPKQPFWKVRKLLWKRSVGLGVNAAAKSSQLTPCTARSVMKKIGAELDQPRQPQEVRRSAIADYTSGAGMPEIARKYGVGISSVHRWVIEAGVKRRTHSEAKALSCAQRPVGREIVGRKGLFQSRKDAAWIPTDSIYEFARLEQLEADPAVASMSRCSIRIRYQFDGRVRTYIPDFMVQMHDGSKVVEEVKPQKFVHDPIVQAKASAARAHLASMGIGYRMVSEPDIGHDRISSCVASSDARLSPAYQSMRKERRREQRRIAQRAYVLRKKAIKSA